jgi:hypothetical protein
MKRSNKWLRVYEKHAKDEYAAPEGWDSREYVADQLQCSEDKVSSLLSPAIRNGEVEMRTFNIWDKGLRRVIRKVFYRKVPEGEILANDEIDEIDEIEEEIIDLDINSVEEEENFDVIALPKKSTAKGRETIKKIKSDKLPNLRNIPLKEKQDIIEDIFNSGVERRVRARRRTVLGTFKKDHSVVWDDGKVSYPTVSTFVKNDISFI